MTKYTEYRSIEVGKYWHLDLVYDIKTSKDMAHVDVRLYWLGELPINSSSENLCGIKVNNEEYSVTLASPALKAGERKLIHTYQTSVPFTEEPLLSVKVEAFFDMKVTLEARGGAFTYYESKKIGDAAEVVNSKEKMFFTVEYTIPPTRQNHRRLILAHNQEEAITILKGLVSGAKVSKVLGGIDWKMEEKR